MLVSGGLSRWLDSKGMVGGEWGYFFPWIRAPPDPASWQAALTAALITAPPWPLNSQVWGWQGLPATVSSMLLCFPNHCPHLCKQVLYCILIHLPLPYLHGLYCYVAVPTTLTFWNCLNSADCIAQWWVMNYISLLNNFLFLVPLTVSFKKCFHFLSICLSVYVLGLPSARILLINLW